MVALAILGACSKKADDYTAEKAELAKAELESEGAQLAAEAAAAKAEPAYVSAKGRYSVGKVFGTLEEKDMTDPQGVVWQSANWSTKKSMYSTQFADFASPEAALAEMKAFEMADPSEMSRDEQKTFQGRPGRELGMTTGSGMVVSMRLIVDGARVYKTMAGTKVEHENVTAFLDSLKIEGEVAPTAVVTGADSDAMRAGREVIALYKEVVALGASTTGDCVAFNTRIDPLRDRLWDLGKRHPGVFKQLSNSELKSLGAVDAQNEVHVYLKACIASDHVKEFIFAMGKVLNATQEERAAAAMMPPAATPDETAAAAVSPPAASPAPGPTTKSAKRRASGTSKGVSGFENERAKVLKDLAAKQPPAPAVKRNPSTEKSLHGAMGGGAK